MIKLDPKTLLNLSLLPTLILFLTGMALLPFALGTELTTPVLLIGGGLLVGYLLTKRLGEPKPKP